MDTIVLVLGVIVGCGIVGTMTRWYVSGGYGAFSALIRRSDDGSYATMPWPVGVQEEDEVHWHIPLTVTAAPGEATSSIEDLPSAPPVTRPPTRPQPRPWRGRR